MMKVSMKNLNQYLKEFFTTIGAKPVDTKKLHVAAFVRLVAIIPTIYFLTFISLVEYSK